MNTNVNTPICDVHVESYKAVNLQVMFYWDSKNRINIVILTDLLHNIIALS